MSSYRFLLVLFYSIFIIFGHAEKIRFISTENPVITYYNPKHMSFINMSTHQYGNDPLHYVDLHMQYIWSFHNNVSVDFKFYEFIGNSYKPTFLTLRYKMCNLVHKDMFFGLALRQGKFLKPCPFPAGLYSLYNMTLAIKHIPKDLLFTKGRIYCNMSSTETKEIISSGHIDMEVKEINK